MVVEKRLRTHGPILQKVGIEEYILNGYMDEIKDESMVKQRALLM